MKELEKLIEFIQEKYDEYTLEWKLSENYLPLNMKRCRVENVYHDKSLLRYVLDYRNFIELKQSDFQAGLMDMNLILKFPSRVKALNSIQQKLEIYMKKKEEGKIATNKCLNDLFGIRIVLLEDTNYEKISKFVQSKFPNLKCIDANKTGKNGLDYHAVHIYFGKDDNTNFQWELQVWDESHRQCNLDSHSKYKQAYKIWELDNEKEMNNDD